MKNKIKSILAGLLSLSCLMTPLIASAQVTMEECFQTSDDGIHTDFDVILEADTFHYTGTGCINRRESVGYYYGHLETDVTNANSVVVGIGYQEGTTEPEGYVLHGLDDSWLSGSILSFSAWQLDKYLDGRTLQVGDLLYIDPSTVNYAMTFPIQINLLSQSVVEYEGNGYDLFGKDFNKILRYELYLHPGAADISNYTNLPIEKGEVNNDDEINLLDVVSVNKHLLSGYDIGFYGQLAADVDNDGRVTPTDSLNILKKVVGVLDSFEEIQ